MKNVLVIVNGYPRSGKDSFIDFCCEHLEEFYVEKHSTIDTVKILAKFMGWDGEKTPEMRCMLSELKDLYTKYFDGPLNEIKSRISCNDYLFTCMREPSEIDKTINWCKENNIECYSVLVRSPREEIDHSSHSDTRVLMGNYSHSVLNNGSLDDLKKVAEDFCFVLTHPSK